MADPIPTLLRLPPVCGRRLAHASLSDLFLNPDVRRDAIRGLYEALMILDSQMLQLACTYTGNDTVVQSIVASIMSKPHYDRPLVMCINLLLDLIRRPDLSKETWLLIVMFHAIPDFALQCYSFTPPSIYETYFPPLPAERQVKLRRPLPTFNERFQCVLPSTDNPTMIPPHEMVKRERALFLTAHNTACHTKQGEVSVTDTAKDIVDPRDDERFYSVGQVVLNGFYAHGYTAQMQELLRLNTFAEELEPLIVFVSQVGTAEVNKPGRTKADQQATKELAASTYIPATVHSALNRYALGRSRKGLKTFTDPDEEGFLKENSKSNPDSTF